MLWIAFGLGTACIAALRDITIEHSGLKGHVMAAWYRVISVLAALPFILMFDLPSAWQFWALVFVNSCMWSVSDLILFSAIPVVGAGSTSRLRRIAILVTFFLWLVITPSMIDTYIAQPLLALAIAGVHILAVYFAVRLKNHDFSWSALKLLAIPILVTACAPILTKLSFDYVENTSQGAFAYAFIQGLCVLAIFAIQSLIKAMREGRHVITDGLPEFFEARAVKIGSLIGLATFAALIVKVYGYALAPNPAYIAVLQLTDTVWLLAYNKWRGVKDKTDVGSGMGIVACAAALILLQIFFE